MQTQTILSWTLALTLMATVTGLSQVLAQPASGQQAAGSASAKQKPVYACPMHPEVKSDQPGKCSICGMTLQLQTGKEKPGEARISLTTVPGVVRPGAPFVAQLKVTDESGAPVRKFDLVHEKLLHLIIVSRDLSYFDHVHPVLNRNTFSIKTSVPRAGEYRMFADFVPQGGSQVIGKLDFTAQGTAAPVRLKPDPTFTKTFGSLEVTLTAPVFKAGESAELVFTVKDAKNGKPVTRLQPYLGAMGHCVIIDESGTEFLHSHPLEGGMSHEDAGHHAHGAAKRFGGPEVRFHTQFPKPGIYKTWGQFNYQGKIVAADFTFEVK